MGKLILVLILLPFLSYGQGGVKHHKTTGNIISVDTVLTTTIFNQIEVPNVPYCNPNYDSLHSLIISGVYILYKSARVARWDTLNLATIGVSQGTLNDSCFVLRGLINNGTDSSIFATRKRVQKGIDSVCANFYPNTNPSGYISSVDSAVFATRKRVQKGIDSIVANFYPNTNPNGYISSYTVDTGIIATRRRVQKAVDSIILNFYPNTNPNGYISSYTVDSSVFSTKKWRQKGIDSIVANFYPNSNPSGYISSYTVDTGIIATRLRVQKAIDSITANYYSKTTSDNRFAPISVVGSVTSVNAGFGTSFTTITSSGNVTIDTGLIATRLRVQKAVDSLNVLIATKGVGTVTSISAGWGTTFTAITGSGSIIVDSVAVATRLRVQKAVDSLNVNIALKANIASPTFTGTPAAPTATSGANSTQIATTAYLETYYKDSSFTNATTSFTPTTTVTNKLYTVTYNLTAQAGALLINNSTSTWANGQNLIFYIKGTAARALTYGTDYVAGTDITPLPATTSTTKTIILQFTKNNNDGKMYLTGKADGF